MIDNEVDAVRQAHYTVDKVEDELMDIVHKLEEARCVQKANSLNTITDKLVRWSYTLPNVD